MTETVTANHVYNKEVFDELKLAVEQEQLFAIDEETTGILVDVERVGDRMHLVYRPTITV